MPTQDLHLKRIDTEFVRRAKHAALDRGMTLKEFILESVERQISETRPQAPKTLQKEGVGRPPRSAGKREAKE